jgi:hypothetical protein
MLNHLLLHHHHHPFKLSTSVTILVMDMELLPSLIINTLLVQLQHLHVLAVMVLVVVHLLHVLQLDGLMYQLATKFMSLLLHLLLPHLLFKPFTHAVILLMLMEPSSSPVLNILLVQLQHLHVQVVMD